jgi:uroporphyrinogen decarboxylase
MTDRSLTSTTRRLLIDAIRREPVARRPLWVMRQAGRYLPEYRALRRRHGFKVLAESAELATEVTLMPLKRFPFDAAIIFADIMSPVAALGIEFDFDPGPVVARPIRDASGVERLRRPAPQEIAPEVIQALKLTRAALPSGTALLGFCGAPWTLAAYLVEGRSAKDFPTLRALAAAKPHLLSALLERLTDLMSAYLLEQVEAGADAVQIFDSWAGLLSRASWERIVRPHVLALLNAVGRSGAPRILFVQNAPHLVDAYASLPAEVIGVDWRVDVRALQCRHPHRAVQGNLDPAVLTHNADATRQATLALLDHVAPRGHIVNLGHGILPDTPLASVEAMVETVHAERLS